MEIETIKDNKSMLIVLSSIITSFYQKNGDILYSITEGKPWTEEQKEKVLRMLNQMEILLTGYEIKKDDAEKGLETIVSSLSKLYALDNPTGNFGL